MDNAGRIWLKEWKRKSWTSTRSKKAKESPSGVEVPRWNEEGAQKQDIQNKKVVRRLLGKNFSLCLENETCSVCKVGRANQRKLKK